MILRRTLQQTMKLLFLSIRILFYSESKEAEILEDGTEKICHQKSNLDFLQKINV
jgi:hypothetical protein